MRFRASVFLIFAAINIFSICAKANGVNPIPEYSDKPALSAPYVYSPMSTGQAVIFNDNWKFNLINDSTANASSPEFNDSDWQTLSLPHDWSTDYYPSPSLNSCTGYFPGGIGWYRKNFTINDSLPKHHIFFEGVYNRSEVYINGHLLGKRPNGYISFYYDITPYLNPGENVIAVKVDHSREADSRYYTGSGIYRDVYLIASGEDSLSPWGLGWKALSISHRKAVVEIEYSAELNSSPKNFSIDATIRDAEGRIVAHGSRSLSDNKGNMNLNIKNPSLWDIGSPYLYNLDFKLLRHGKIIDSTSCRIGLRTLRFDPDKGFFLNGRNQKVKGVCIHHDAGVLGAAVPRRVWERRLQNLKKIGTNAIRLSHNPQAPYLYDLCDELGLLVMDEISDEWEFPKRKWITGWNDGTPKFDGTSDFFEEWIERDTEDMVRRDRNHPSVVFWSIGNEVDYPNDPYSHPSLDSIRINQPNFGGYNPDAPSAMRIGEVAKRLTAVVRNIDSSRPVTGALAGVAMSNHTAYPDAVDIVGYNYTENRYNLDHKLYPKRVIYGSENGRGYKEWKAVRDNDHIFGQFIWTGVEYLGEARKWPTRGLGPGMLDFGGFIKPSGKFREAMWSERPVAYLGTYPNHGDKRWLSGDAPAVWNYNDGMDVRVVCYTNAASAHLLLDGEEVGETKPFDDEEGIIFWDIPYSAGELKVEAFDKNGAVVATDSIATSGRPYALIAKADTYTVDTSNPIAHIEVEVVDENGNPVILADNMVTCRVTGAGKLLGLEGTSNTDMSHPKDHRRRVNNGHLLAYIERADGPGEIHVIFTSPLLESAELTLHSK